MKSSMLLPTCIRVFDIFLWVAKYYFELCSDLVILPLKMLYTIYYVTLVNKTDSETETTKQETNAALIISKLKMGLPLDFKN